ncbi:phosphonate C-P lyase system protein PhnL [Ktedonospora formicarum]|uniref:ABC transporter n=1 Tax=Ktedonospora formicarum TaxID=2778364 RepID=A0A8J3HQX3_9CHLR|nr:ATP-binding cassette domain-containing protein [Ktedonospora formicarum]GHO41954.1 ABC transporter [Ktedonospora formicarum]
MHTIDAPYILNVENLGKQFQLHLVDGRIITPFIDVTFNVRQGSLFMISGKSGAGKTTILKCIYRTYLTNQGHIWYDSEEFGTVDIASADENIISRLREQELGFCSQFLKVLPRVPALDVTAEPLIRRGVPRNEALEEASRWLARLQIEESRWLASPLTFSGGEQQRLNLARAFIAEPRILLLDEPTASLDAVSKSIVLDMIGEATAKGVTILTVSHDIAAIQDLADDTFWLEV